jgi:hypothetical protein
MEAMWAHSSWASADDFARRRASAHFFSRAIGGEVASQMLTSYLGDPKAASNSYRLIAITTAEERMMNAVMPAPQMNTTSKLTSDLAKCMARKAQHLTEAELATASEVKAFHLASATQVDDEIEEIQDVLRALSVWGTKVA